MSYFSISVAQRGVGSPWDGFIYDATEQAGVDPTLVKAVIAAESAWDPNAASDSSIGLMQINYQAHQVSRQSALVPEWNITFGTNLLAAQLARRPTVELALAAYNAGTSRSDADLQTRIDQNTNRVGTYVATVLDFWSWYRLNDLISIGGEIIPEPFPVSRPVPATVARRRKPSSGRF